MTTQPFDAPPPDSLYIELAGQKWPIPQLTIRQLRIIVPGMLKLATNLAPVFNAQARGESNVAMLAAANFSTQDIDLMTDIVYAALTKLHKTLQRAEFEDMPFSINELALALPIIMAQAGMEQKKDSSPGEAKAGSQTGTA